MKIYLASLLLFLANLNVYSQSAYDSTLKALQTKLDTTSNDCTKIQTMLDLAWVTQSNDPKQAIEWNSKIIDLVEGKNDLKALAVAHFGIANAHYIQGNYDQAINSYLVSLRYDEKIGRKRGIVSTLSNMGLVYESMGEYDKALELYQQSLQMAKEINHKTAVANNLNNMAVVKANLGEQDGNITLLREAIDLYRQVLILDEESGQDYWTAKTLNNIGNAMNDLGTFSGQMHYKDSALSYFNRSLTLKKKVNDVEGQITTLGNIGLVYSQLNKNEKALQNYHLAYNMAQNGDFKEARVWTLEFMSDIYSKLEKWKDAFKYNRELVIAKDSLLNAEKRERIATVEAQYQTEKKEKENQELRALNAENKLKLAQESSKRNSLIFILLIMFILAIFSFFYFRKRQQQKLSAISLKEQKMRFKAVIEAEEKERMRIAKELHDGVGQLLSVVKMTIGRIKPADKDDDRIRTTTDLVDESIKEIRGISHNLMPYTLVEHGLKKALEQLAEKINSAGLLQIHLNLNFDNNSLDNSTQATIYRIVQEVLNNMIKHSQAKNISIKLVQKDGKLLLTMKDDGIGFDTSKIEQGEGIGWKNIISRVITLDGHIQVNSNKGKGTSINIDLAM